MRPPDQPATLSGVMVLTSGAISTMDCYLPPAHNAKGESRWGEQNPTLFILFIYIYVFGYCLPQNLYVQSYSLSVAPEVLSLKINVSTSIKVSSGKL